MELDESLMEEYFVVDVVDEPSVACTRVFALLLVSVDVDLSLEEEEQLRHEQLLYL